MLIISVSCSNSRTESNSDIVIENEQVKIVIGNDGTAKSLIFKPSNEECLIKGKKVSISSITQARPWNNEIKLAYPNKEMTFHANSVRREGDKLIVGYELIPYEAVISVRSTPNYITFCLEDFIVEEDDYHILISEPPVSEMWFLQLPVRSRTHFGDWLNVVWDDRVAINLLGTDPHARIDSEKGDGFYMLQAGVSAEVKLRNVCAALITCSTDRLMDNIALVEEDFEMPHGVESRRHEKYNCSYYFSSDVHPGNLDTHLKYAKMGGFRTFLVYYPAFIESNGYRNLGNYDWRQSKYPNGKEDLGSVLSRIEEAGMVPGFQFLHTHIGRDSRYVTPVPDHRLNLRRIFTLAAPLGMNDTIIQVEQNPANITMAENMRVLKIGTELISYDNYTSTRPYKFTGCVRGVDQTTVNSQPTGTMFGLLDVSEFGGRSVYIDQNTGLQEEIAEKIATFYQVGFRFVYFDGSEGVNPPFWYHVSGAQWKVYRKLKPEPLFAEGAAKTHFSWHMLTRGNAFDVFKPEYMKEAIRKFPADEAPRMKENFTNVNFGWLGYFLPDEYSVGTQPDMLEFASSRAAAWDCPISLQSNLGRFDAHARTPDNLEVLRRWEEVRVQKWLTEEQKKLLQNLEQEHILLLNEQEEFELLPYEQIKDVANGSREVRAFIFERNNDLYIVYWHISDNKNLKIPLDPEDISLFESLGQEIQFDSDADDNLILLPVGKRRYIKTNNLTKEDILTAFKDVRIVD